MWFAVVCVLFPLALGALVNVTIDDTYGDPNTGAQIIYTPPGSWNVGQNCTGCTAHLNPQLLYDQTWHDGTFNPIPGSNSNPNEPIYATIQFSGTAVYVQCVIADSFTSPDGNSDMVFYIDNDIVGSYVRPPLGSGAYFYNVTVYANSSIPAGNHTLVVQTGHVNGNKSLLLIDTVIYSTDTSTPPPSGPSSPLQSVSPLLPATTLSNSPTSTATPVAQPSSTHVNSTRVTAIASVCAASGVAVILIAFLLWYRRRQQKRGLPRASTDSDLIDPPEPFHVNDDVGGGSSLGSITPYNGVPTASTSQPGRLESRFGDTVITSSADNENAYMLDAFSTVSPGQLPSSSNLYGSSVAGYSGGGVLGIDSDMMSQVANDDAPPAYDPFQRPPTIRRPARKA